VKGKVASIAIGIGIALWAFFAYWAHAAWLRVAPLA
jgi:hypothetical protein